MERRLKTVQNKITSKEDRLAREKNKFQVENRKCIAMLKEIYQDLNQRNELRRTEKNGRKVIMLSAKCRIKLKDANELVNSLVADYRRTRNTAGKNPVESQKLIINEKFRATQHIQAMYDICYAMYHDDPAEKNDAAPRAELMDGVVEENESLLGALFRRSPRIEPVEDIQANNEVVFAGPSQMEVQWLRLLEESDQTEAQYLKIIEENVLTLNELAKAMGAELDRQDGLIADVGDKIDRNHEKLEKLDGQVDKALELRKESNRCLYIIAFVALATIIVFVLIKFVFQNEE